MKLQRFNNLPSLFLCILMFVSCGTEDNSEPIDVDEVDETPPVISLNTGISEIEVTTTIGVQITEQSDIEEVSVYFGDENILSLKEKNFEFTIDPFNYPPGEYLLMITAIDEYGNISTIERRIDLSRLILRIPETNINDLYYFDNYVLINNLDGQLIDFKKANLGQETAFYGGVDFEKQNFIASLIAIPTAENPNKFSKMNSFRNIEPGTVLPNMSEIIQADNYRENFERDQQIDIEVSYPNPFGMSGNGYFMGPKENDTYTLSFSSEINSPFFVAYSLPFGPTIREDYRYFILDDLDKTTYGTEDFVSPETFYEVNLPETLVGSSSRGWFGIILTGYKNEEEFNDFRSHDLINYGSTENIFTNGLDLPVFAEFEIYEKVIHGSLKTGYQFSTKQKGMEFKELPNVDLQLTNDIIQTTGNYDYVLFGYENYDFNTSPFLGFQWYFYDEPRESIAIPYFNFEFPEEISNTLEIMGLRPIPDQTDIPNSGITVSLIETENNLDYKKLMFEHSWYYNSRGDWYRLEYKFTDL